MGFNSGFKGLIKRNVASITEVLFSSREKGNSGEETEVTGKKRSLIRWILQHVKCYSCSAKGWKRGTQVKLVIVEEGL